MALKWITAHDENPGFSVYYANPKRDPDVTYVIRRKRKTPDFTPTVWRVFVRSKPGTPLTTVYVADKLAEGKTFCEEMEALHVTE